MIKEINHFGLVVRDLTASLAFYQDVLGAQVVFHKMAVAAQTDIVYVQIAGGLIELMERESPAPDEVYGVTHIGFITDDLDTDYSRVVAAGYEGRVAPRTAGTGVGRMSFVTDPNGAQVELIEREDLRVPPVEHPVITAFDHYALAVDDLEDAMRFYGKQLGLTTVRVVDEPGEGARSIYLNYDDIDALELVQRSGSTDGSAFAHIGLRVRSVEDALGVFAAHGVPVDASAVHADETGGGRVGIIHDPDGLEIQLLDRPDLREL